MRFECQNKYFPCGPKSRLIRALLYTYTNIIVYDDILLSQSVVYCVSALTGPYASPYAYVLTASQPIRIKEFVPFCTIMPNILNLLDTVEPNMEYIAHANRMALFIGRGSTELNPGRNSDPNSN